jgi:hypothetical protein
LRPLVRRYFEGSGRLGFMETLMKNFLITLALILFTGFAFASDKKNELTPEIMFDTADAMRSLTLGALEYTYKINDTIWVGLDGLYGKTVVDDGSGLVVNNSETMWGGAPILYWNMPTLLGATKEKPEGSQAQFYTSFGMGMLRIGSQNEPYGIFGGGLVWESGLPWLGIRVDVKGIFYMLSNSKGSDFNSDLAFSVGPAFMF